MKKILFISILSLVLMTGCGIQSFGSNKSTEANNYLKEKYGKTFDFDDWYCIKYDDTDEGCSKNSMYIYKDGTKVFYNGETNEFQDNYQNKEIIDDATVMFNNFLSSLGDVRLTKNNINYQVTFNTNVKGESYFHDLYEGDIENYAKNGSLIPKLTSGFVISSKGNYKGILTRLEEYANEYYPTNYINLFFINEELYNSEVFPDINDLNCFAKYINGKSYEQNYIQIKSGVYISSAIQGITLTNEDVSLLDTNAIIGAETDDGDPITTYEDYKEIFNEILKQMAERNNVEFIPANPRGNIYKIKFSNNLKERVMQTKEEKLKVYIRFQRGEAGVSNDYYLYYYPSSENKYGSGIIIDKNGNSNDYIDLQDGDYIWIEEKR